MVDWPDEQAATRLTTTEQIIWAHRVDKELTPEDLKPGTTLRVYADLLPASDGTAPFAIHTFNQITGGRAIFPRQAAIANDHFVFTGVDADEKQTAIGRAVRRACTASTKPYYATPGDGIFHFYFPEQGLVMPGQFIPGADSHSRAYGAYGAVGIGVGLDDARVRLGDRLRVLHACEGAPGRVHGQAPAVGRRQGHRPGAAAAGGARQQSQGMSVELVDASGQLPIAYRNTIANMMAEAEAQNGIFAPDDVTVRLVPGEGRHRDGSAFRTRGSRPAPTPGMRSMRRSISSGIRPMIAKPFSPGNAFPAEEVARERITFDKALIGSCTNGSYDDLLQAALVLRAARARGASRVARDFAIFPGSGGVGPADRGGGSAARRRVDRGGVPVGRAARSGSRGAARASARVPTR